MSVLDGVNFGIGRRLPMVLQTEAAECGVACLAMLVGFHGQRTDLADLRRRFGVSLKGATLKDVVRVADQIGLATRPMRLELGELPLVKTPCILHWDLNHFVVLKSVGRNSAVIHDPAVGLRRLSMAEFSKHFTGIALEATPTGGFARAEAPPRVKLRQMLGRFTGLKRSLLQLLILALAIEVFAIASPLFMQWVVDHALISADYDLLLTLVIGFALLLLIRISVSTMRSWMLMTLGASIKVQARTNLFSHLVTLPTSFFEARHLGDVMSRFGSQSTILKAITTELIEVVLDGLMVSLTLMIMFLYAPVLALLVVAGAFLYGILRWAFYAPLRQASAETIIWGAKRDSHFLETLRGIKTIKLFNAQDSRRAHWLHLLVETVNRQLTTQKLGILFKTANSLLLGGLTLLVVWLGAREVLANAFSVGMLLAFIAYKDQFLSRVSALIDRLVELQMLKLHAERLADIALSSPEPRDLMPRDRLNKAPLSIEVRDLGFRYGENDPLVLDDLSFRITAGESVAIAGPSGCGKTTLLKLMIGLLTPSTGDILIDGMPIKRVGVDVYRSMIGVVMQDDQLFAGSLADNISFFSEEPDQELIEHCARLAAIHDDIMAMPMGYHTLIGDMGTMLSGGQKQRVLIARALYRRPSILFLDEATSHLDVQRENAVSEAIRATSTTRIIVAHRPETIRSADRVITLNKGRLANELQVLKEPHLSERRGTGQLPADT
ncbi:MAG: peptidase domain-containing ABC transporter [Geminicoccales bacterium]